jgi:hypothetical protein
MLGRRDPPFSLLPFFTLVKNVQSHILNCMHAACLEMTLAKKYVQTVSALFFCRKI